MNKKLQAAIVGLSATAMSAVGASAQAATFGSSTFTADFNGSFTPTGTTTAVNLSTNNPTTGYLRQWNTGGGDLNYVVPFATASGSTLAQGYVDLDANTTRTDAVLQSGGTNNLLTSPDGVSQWYIVADSFVNYRRPISQTIDGLIAGNQYEVSFWQAAGQWKGLKGAYNEGWDVSLGTTTRTAGSVGGAALMNPAASAPSTSALVGPWQQQTLTFTANSNSEVLKFLATTPSGDVPPMSLLTGVTFKSSNTAVPEPLEYVGTIFGFGVCLMLRSKFAKTKSDDAK